MVPHKAMRMLPFLVLYGREALVPEEIPHLCYASSNSYDVAVKIIKGILFS